MAIVSQVVPPLRLGRLLSERRITSGLSIQELAARTSLTIGELSDIEAGRAALSDDSLAEIVSAYGIDVGSLVPARARLVVDLEEGRVAVDQNAADIDPLGGSDQVLASYLGLVYSMRRMPIGTPISFRDVDIQVLSAALEERPSRIEDRLEGLVLAPQGEVGSAAARFRKRLWIPAAGILVGATAVGAIVMIAGSDGSGTETDTQVSAPVLQPAVEVEIGQPVVLERESAQPAATLGAGEVDIGSAETLER